MTSWRDAAFQMAPGGQPICSWGPGQDEQVVLSYLVQRGVIRHELGHQRAPVFKKKIFKSAISSHIEDIGFKQRLSC